MLFVFVVSYVFFEGLCVTHYSKRPLSHYGHALEQKALDESRVVNATAEVGILHDGLLEWDRGLDAGDHVFAQCPRHAVDTRGAVGGSGDDLGDHGIVVRRDRVTGVGMRIDANAATTGGIVKIDIAGAGLEIFFWILSIDAALDGMSTRLGVDDVRAEMFACGDLNLVLHEITTIDLFGDRVFDLNAGVHFHEVEIPVIVDEILDGAGILISDAFAEFDRGIAHLFAKLGGHERRWTFLHDLLVTALQGAIALTEVYDAAVLVAEDLKLNVVGINDELLDVNGTVAKGFFGLHAGGVVALNEASLVAGDAHAATTTTGDGLNHHGIPNLAGHTKGLGLIRDDAIATGRNRNASSTSAVTGGIFVAHHANRLGCRANELNIAGGADIREVSVFC